MPTHARDLWAQRSRINWAISGDRNTRFFHASVVARNRRNSIRSIQNSEGVWLTEEKEILQAFITHFKQIYQKGTRTSVFNIYPAELLQSLPKIPPIFLTSIEALPSNLEIQQALFSLGPHKSAGPDGFNAKVIQENWESFGPSICHEVSEFFRSGHMKQSISRSNLILVPKTENSTKVTHFRPISVCNLIYKLISKIIATRMKPFISLLISPSQCAFIPGREISENVILFKEVLHSFKQKKYKNREFCLKIDLSKAFDRMDWDFLSDILPLYGFPPLFCSWIMGCVKSAEFSLVFNGRGDEFFKPQCGLRQGCAMSPYLFILGMDILSRGFAFLVEKKMIKGVKVTPTAKPLTDYLYADDLLVFGSANTQEVEVILQNLSCFMSVSGQQIGPDKSDIWFSFPTPNDQRDIIAGMLSVSQSCGATKYLGSPISDGVAAYDFLIESFSSRLNSWKSKLLSPAGRIVLIKSVLHSMPIYHMTTSKIPSRVIKALTNLVRRFFWGKTGTNRYMAYVSWEKILKPVCEGGLGIRDLTAINDSLLLKVLFKVASGSNAQWVDLVKAKYFPKSLFWHSARSYNCTALRRSIMNLRSTLAPLTTIILGNGNCSAFGQPWFNGALQLKPSSYQQSALRVKDLLLHDDSGWNMDEIVQVLGFSAAMKIISTVSPPTDPQSIDRLIFLPSSNGSFSAKHAYQHLAQEGSNQRAEIHSVWKVVWKKGWVLPRLRVFLWRLLHNALPLGHILASRGIRIDSMCATCGCAEEDSVHFMFLCDFARSCWFSSSIPLRSHVMIEPLTQTLSILGQELSEEQWTDFASIAWAIWRCRNEKVYEGKQPTLDRFSFFLKNIQMETTISRSHAGPLVQAHATQVPISNDAIICITDGSWSTNWEGGLGYTIMQGSTLIAY